MVGLYMENLSDIDLVNKIKQNQNTNQCLEELIYRHSGIYLDIVNSYMKRCPYPSLRDDIINDKAIAIYNSALRYDKDRGAKFSTFLGNEAKWKCLNATNKNKKNNKYVEMDESKLSLDKIKINKCENNTKLEEEVLSFFDKELETYPDTRVKKIFRMRYSGLNKLTPWRKISKKMNLSIQGCINIHNAALKKISKNVKTKYETIS